MAGSVVKLARAGLSRSDVAQAQHSTCASASEQKMAVGDTDDTRSVGHAIHARRQCSHRNTRDAGGLSDVLTGLYEIFGRGPAIHHLSFPPTSRLHYTSSHHQSSILHIRSEDGTLSFPPRQKTTRIHARQFGVLL
eukprot:5228936-Pyramimonas_sp.AAC.1